MNKNKLSNFLPDSYHSNVVLCSPSVLKVISKCPGNGKCPVSKVIDYGGQGSGHHGHQGRPGLVGGSAPSAGRGGSLSILEKTGKTGKTKKTSSGSPDFDVKGETERLKARLRRKYPGIEFIDDKPPAYSPSTDRPVKEKIADFLRDSIIPALTIAPGEAIRQLRNADDKELIGRIDDAISNADIPPETMVTLELIKRTGLTTIPMISDKVEALVNDLYKSPGQIESGLKKFVGDIKAINAHYIDRLEKDYEDIGDGVRKAENVTKKGQAIKEKSLEFLRNLKDVALGDKRLAEVMNDLMATKRQNITRDFPGVDDKKTTKEKQRELDLKKSQIEIDIEGFPGDVQDRGQFAVNNRLDSNKITDDELAEINKMVISKEIGFGDGSVADALKEIRRDKKRQVTSQERLFELGAEKKLNDSEARYLLDMIKRDQVAQSKSSMTNVIDILRETVEKRVKAGHIEDTKAAKDKYIDMLRKRQIGPEGRLGLQGLHRMTDGCTSGDSGCPLTKMKFEEMPTRDIGWHEIFEFDDSNVLEIILKNFKKLKGKLLPPLKLGHDEKQQIVQNSGYPSAGWITNLKSKGNKLLAYFSGVPESIVRLIENGSYKRISAEIYNNYIDPDTKVSLGPAMRAVSILGADVPRIKTLKDLSIVYHSDRLPYKTFELEENAMLTLEEIMTMMDRIKEELSKLAGMGQDKVEDAVEALQEKFGKTQEAVTALSEKQTSENAELEKAIKKAKKTGVDQEAVKLSETVKSQESIITQLSETVKTIGSELKGAQQHILETKKAAFRAAKSKIFTPALVDKAMEMINFSEEDKIVELMDHMQKLQEDNALFLDKPLEIEEQEFTQSMNAGNSMDKLHNEVLSLSEKDKISYKEAFDKVMLLRKE